MSKKLNQCPLCGGRKNPGNTTFAADLNFGVVVVRNVPATVCTQCGAEWISHSVSQKLERILAAAKKKKSQVEIGAFERLAG